MVDSATERSEAGRKSPESGNQGGAQSFGVTEPATVSPKVCAPGDFSSGKSSCAWDVRKSACPVPEADNFNSLIITSQPVDDAIGTANHFPQIRLLKFRHGTADFGKIRQIFGAGDQFVTQRAAASELCWAT